MQLRGGNPLRRMGNLGQGAHPVPRYDDPSPRRHDDADTEHQRQDMAIVGEQRFLP